MQIIKRIILSALAFGLMLSPAVVFAKDTTTTNRTATPNFCTRVVTVKGAITDKFTELDKERTDIRKGVLDKLQIRKSEESTEVDKTRTEIKTQFDEDISSIDQEATTAAQKAAVFVFKSTVTSAMLTRKTAADTARLTFRNSVAGLVTQRNDAIKAAGDKAKTATQNAIAKAQSDCAAGMDAASVRTAFMASLKAANQQFHLDLQAVTKLGTQVEALAKTRNDAIKAANQTFKQTIAAARKTLKLAFPSA